MKPIFAVLAAAMTVAWACQAPAQEDLSFRDEFTGSKLAPEFRVLNPDPDRMAMVEGDYVLLLTHRDHKNGLSYTSPLPESYELVARFETFPTERYQGVQISLSEGNENRIILSMYITNRFGSDDRGFFFNKHLNGEWSNIWERYKANPKPFYMKLIKSGVEYTAQYSMDGSKWSTIGTHVSVRPYRFPTITAYIWNGEAPEGIIKVDSFEIVDLTSR